MRKGKYIIYGLFIFAIAWAGGGLALWRMIYCLERMQLTKYFFEFFVWLLVLIIAGGGGTWLAIMQMKAPPDPKKIVINYDKNIVETRQNQLINLLKEHSDDLNNFRLTYFTDDQNNLFMTHSALIFHYKHNGRKHVDRYDAEHKCFVLPKEYLYIIPSNFRIVKNQKADKTKMWIGYCSSEDQKFILKSYTILESEDRKISLLYCDYLDDLSVVDKPFVL